MSTLEDEDLRTDAVPNAPRKDPEDSNNKKNVSYPKVKTGHKSKSSFSQTKQIPHTAFANVINITNSTKVHIGTRNNLTINSSSVRTKQTEARKTSQHLITKEIRTLFESKKRVNREDLSFVSQHIDDKWKDIGRALEYSKGQIQAFEKDYKEDGMGEIIFKMLYSWMCQKPEEATAGKLARMLWDCEQQEAVELWVADISKKL